MFIWLRSTLPQFASYLSSFKTDPSKQTFVSQFSLYCAPYTRSIASSYQLTAEQLEQVVVIIRHNPKVYEGIKCQYKGKLYDVINDSIDDSSNYLSCDYLTLKQVTKGA
ncbi:phage head closure protein [Lactiplantibacillus plantarum]|uniref:phage head closure protein n=1 Tax=Lactiplantibacillus plantarum TaxID=1590 RepID=UPI0030E7AD86